MNVQCPHCEEVFELPDDHDADSEFKCPHCEELVQPSDLPSIEFEGCEKCASDSEVEDEGNATWKDGGWVCDQCGGSC